LRYVVSGRDCEDFGVFEDLGAGLLSGASQSRYDFAGVDGATGNLTDDAQITGIVPGDGRVFECVGASEFGDAGKNEARIDFQRAQNFPVACEDVTEVGEWAGGGLVKDHAASAAAGTVADGCGFEDENGFAGREFGEPGGGRETCEARADNGEVHVAGQRAPCRAKIDGPRWRAPGMRISAHCESSMSATGIWDSPQQP